MPAEVPLPPIVLMGPAAYRVVDGRHRFCVAKHLGFVSIPATIMAANVQRPRRRRPQNQPLGKRPALTVLCRGLQPIY
jgi:hypothetical protein